jgi:hypothetical protein
VTPSATSGNNLELSGSSPISLSVVASCVRLQLRPLPSAGITRFHRYYEPLRHPRRLFARTIPLASASPNSGRVSSCISLFEACSAFTHVTACMLARSPMRPSTPKAPAASLPPPLLRLLPGGSNQFPDGFNSRCGPPPFTAHPSIRTFCGPQPGGREFAEPLISISTG